MSTRSRNWLKFGALVALAFVLGLFFAGLLDFPRAGFAQERAAHTPIVRVNAPNLPAARPLIDLSDAYAAVAEAVRPSVVYIESETPATDQDQDQSDIFGQLPPQFRQMIPQQPRRSQPQQNEQEFDKSSGSGFIVSPDGYILTNNHVIEGATKVTVRLLDGREYTAKVIGTDKDTDIGVLKIDATGLTPAALGSSDATRVGEWVLAIGNPLGSDLTFTVTQGIVSAKGRAQLNFGNGNDGGRQIQDYIQTDAVINRGNSGGPLVNARGEVIGINAAIASSTGYYTGYAFAVPIDLARKVMDQIIAHGKVERAGMGVMVNDADKDDAQYLGLPDVEGVKISRFASDDSPAARAGLQAGDVIIAIDGQPIKYTSQLQQVVGFRRPGDVVKVEVVRRDGHHTYSVTLAPQDQPTTEASNTTSPASGKSESNSASAQLGLTTEPVTPSDAEQLGLPAGTHGLLIDHIGDNSPALGKVCPADAMNVCGAPGVITKAEGHTITSDKDLAAAIADAHNGVITVDIMTGDKDHKGTVNLIRLAVH